MKASRSSRIRKTYEVLFALEDMREIFRRSLPTGFSDEQEVENMGCTLISMMAFFPKVKAKTAAWEEVARVKPLPEPAAQDRCERGLERAFQEAHPIEGRNIRIFRSGGKEPQEARQLPRRRAKGAGDHRRVCGRHQDLEAERVRPQTRAGGLRRRIVLGDRRKIWFEHHLKEK